jgi:predicted Zn-dependent protease
MIRAFLQKCVPGVLQRKAFKDIEAATVESVQKALKNDSLLLSRPQSPEAIVSVIETLDQDIIPKIATESIENLFIIGRNQEIESLLSNRQRLFEKDAPLAQWINSIAQKIQQDNKLPFKAHVLIVKTDDIMAHSIAPGQITVSTGLLKTLKSEAEVAGVLAHELAHGVNQDAIKKIPHDITQRFIASAKTEGISVDMYQEIKKNLSFNREFKADAVGVQLSNTAGFNPTALKIALSRVNHRLKKDRAKLPVQLPAQTSSTHPALELRQDRLAKEVSENNLSQRHNKETGAVGYLQKLDYFIQRSRASYSDYK